MTPLPRLPCPKCGRSPMHIEATRNPWGGDNPGLVASCVGCGLVKYDDTVRVMLGAAPEVRDDPTPLPTPPRDAAPKRPRRRLQKVPCVDPSGDAYIGIVGTECKRDGCTHLRRLCLNGSDVRSFCSDRCRSLHHKATQAAGYTPVPDTQCASPGCDKPHGERSKYCGKPCRLRTTRRAWRKRHPTQASEIQRANKARRRAAKRTSPGPRALLVSWTEEAS